MSILTVIVAAYNAEKYIDRCITSVISQNDDTELIVINDASTDGTGERVKSYGSRVRLINLRENCGCVSKTRNIGLSYASGSYITFLDADDWYEPGAVNKIIEYINIYKADILKFEYTLVFPNGVRQTPMNGNGKTKLVEKKMFKNDVYPYFIKGIYLNSVWSSVFKKDILCEVFFPEDFQTAEDAAFCAKAYTNAKNVLFIPERLYCYFQSGSGLTGSGLNIMKKYKYNLKLMHCHLSLLKSWGMDNIYWRIMTVLRPLRLTFDKLIRMKDEN